VVALVCPRAAGAPSWLCEKAQRSPPILSSAGGAGGSRPSWSTAVWNLKRAAFAPPVDETALPGSAIERFDATDLSARLVQFLRFLLPASMRGLPV